MTINPKPKPGLHLLSGRTASAPEVLAKLWERMTGEKATPQSIAEFKRLLEEAQQKHIKGNPPEQQ